MSHSHEHDFSDLLSKSTEDNTVSVPNEPVEDDQYQETWAVYRRAEASLVSQISQMLAVAVSEHLPEAKYIVLYQDTSHDAPHGHIEAVLDESGNNLTAHSGDWHDLDWTADIDEWAWDIHHLSPSSFTRMGDRRRLIISIQ